jgi:AAA domain
VTDVSGQEAFSVAVFPESMTIEPGESPELRVRVENTGTSPAYWLHLKPSTSEDGAIRLIPPNPLISGKGLQAEKHARIARLDPGEVATLDARVVVTMKVPAEFLESSLRRLVLTVMSGNGAEVKQTIQVNVRSPRLIWQTAQLEADRRTLKIGLRNTGTTALRDFILELRARDIEQALSQQIIPELMPEASREVAAVLPDSIDLKSQRLNLQGRTRALPLFSWDLPAPKIETASRVMFWLLAPLLPLTLVALFYLRRYRHPLVLQLSDDPVSLLHLLPEQLQEAHRRLEQTSRLDTVLSKAEVTRRTLDESITFFGQTPPEAKAHWLANRIGGRVSPLPQPEGQNEGIQLWEWHLPERFPLNLDRCLLGFPAADSNPQDFLDHLRTIPQTSMRVVLLISPSSDYQRRLYDKTRDRTNKWVAPSRSELTNLLLSPTPEITLANLLASQLTLTQLSPYQLGGGVNREAVFFGRQEILAHIMNRDPANYLVVGGRQLGKSSLLKALERRYAEQPEITCFYLALSNEVLVPRLASALGLSRGAGLEEIAAHVARTNRRFLFLIDEADKFVRHELKSAYRTLETLRRMSEEGHCNFILAGFWELYEQAVLDYRSPLKNFAEIVQLGALEADACRDLAIKPMQSMRLEYADAASIDQLLAATRQRANLMAIACHEILAQLRPDQRTITSDDVHRSLHTERIFEALKGRDAMTEDAEACQWDCLVVYSTIDQEPFDFAALVERLHQHGVTPDGRAIERSLARLELGFVLGRNDQGRYVYRVPLFRPLILRDAPSAKLQVEIDSWKSSQQQSKSPLDR